MIATGAWTDAALALVELELPLWQVRRLAYDEGEWYCALSRERELPDWLDRSIEARHADLALAILSAFVDAQHIAAPASRSSVPAVPRNANPLYELKTGIERSSEFSDLGAAPQSTARIEIDPGARSVFPANDHPGYFRRVRQHRFWQKPWRAVVDVHHPQHRARHHEARAPVRPGSQSLG
jgi:hypothetical protein